MAVLLAYLKVPLSWREILTRTVREAMADNVFGMSAQLAYMAVNLGRFHSARAYAVEALSLAEHVTDDELKAWVRGTQSFAEYYTGNYRQALEYAVDGQRYAGTGSQGVHSRVGCDQPV